MELILLSIFVVVVFLYFYYIFNNGFSACNKLKTKLSQNYKNGNDSKNKNNSKTLKSNTQGVNAFLPLFLVKCYVIQEEGIEIGT